MLTGTNTTIYCVRPLTAAGEAFRLEDMSGRTERVKARETLARFEKIVAEVEVATRWLDELHRRTNGATSSAKGNAFFNDEWSDRYEEMEELRDALDGALAALRRVGGSRERGQAA